MGVLRYFREILTNIKEENEISPLMIHSLTFGGNIVCFSADDKQYHAQYSAAQTAPSAYGYHPVEVSYPAVLRRKSPDNMQDPRNLHTRR